MFISYVQLTSIAKHKFVWFISCGTPCPKVTFVPDKFKAVKEFIFMMCLILLSVILGFKDKSKIDRFPRPPFKRRCGIVSFLMPVSERQFSLRLSLVKLQ